MFRKPYKFFVFVVSLQVQFNDKKRPYKNAIISNYSFTCSVLYRNVSQLQTHIVHKCILNFNT